MKRRKCLGTEGVILERVKSWGKRENKKEKNNKRKKRKEKVREREEKKEKVEDRVLECSKLERPQ